MSLELICILEVRFLLWSFSFSFVVPVIILSLVSPIERASVLSPRFLTIAGKVSFFLAIVTGDVLLVKNDCVDVHRFSIIGTRTLLLSARPICGWSRISFASNSFREYASHADRSEGAIYRGGFEHIFLQCLG